MTRRNKGPNPMRYGRNDETGSDGVTAATGPIGARLAARSLGFVPPRAGGSGFVRVTEHRFLGFPAVSRFPPLELLQQPQRHATGGGVNVRIFLFDLLNTLHIPPF